MNNLTEGKHTTFYNSLVYWLYFVALSHIVLGLILPLLAYSEFSLFYHYELANTFWHTEEIPEPALEFQRWIIALFGPTVASWGILMFWLVKEAHTKQQHHPFNALLLSILAWASLDMAISSIHDFYYHYLLDSIAFLAILIPALLLRYRLKSIKST